MKKIILIISGLLLIITFSTCLYSQNSTTGVTTIKASDLEGHLSFLASPILKGRKNGSDELDITANYLVTQAKGIGLKSLNDGSYIQSYKVIKKSIDKEKTKVQVITEKGEALTINQQLVQLIPITALDFVLEGEVVFAGYGIKEPKYNYNDLDTLNLTGKIVLIMNRAPLTTDGNKCQFEDQKWISREGLNLKLRTLMMARPKAVLVVSDPRSGFETVEQGFPWISGYDGPESMTLAGHEEEGMRPVPGMPKVFLIHRKVADELLNGFGKTLEGLQKEIDDDLKCHSFLIKNRKIRIAVVSKSEEKLLPNVAGLIEGSDQVLKNEVVVFSCHMDHIGGTGNVINPGADDDASGCSALLEIAEAFQSLPEKPLRSILFLWFSGEEIGLFGSRSYVNSPLFPIEKTVADLNIDMIGRVKDVADTSKWNPMTGPDAVFVISDDQSKELNEIARSVGQKNNLTLDFSLSGKNHPLNLFGRSDHYNFVQNNIPILFFTTGIHTDYHTPRDVIDKINFQKMELITRCMYEIGFRVANQKDRILVDNPFSKGKNNQARQKE